MVPGDLRYNPRSMSDDTTPADETIARLGARFEEFWRALSRPVVFFDIEATGTDPVNDRIVELSVVRVGVPPQGVSAPRTWRINPGVRIPVEASEIHGIHDDDLVEAPSFAAIADELAELFTGADLAGFSVGRFDVRFLAAELARATGGRTKVEGVAIEHAGLPGISQHLVRVEADRLLQLKTVTLRGAHCTYDWILIAPSEARLKELEPLFDAWWQSFEPGPGERETGDGQ